MKHAIVVLIIVFVVALLVLPLVYISLGKLKSPFEGSSFGSAQRTLVSQNYIPISATDASEDQIHTGGNLFDLPFEKKCNASGTPMILKDVTTLFNIKEQKASLTSDLFKFSWNLKGVFDKTKPYGKKDSGNTVLFGGGTTPETALVMTIWAGKFNSPACVAYYKKMTPYYHDSGRFFKEYDWEKNGFSLVEKGLSTLNGQAYYWYLFEDARSRGENRDTMDTEGSLLTEKTVRDQKYTAIYDTYNNGIKYRVTFSGSRAQNKSYRNILQIANTYLGTLQLR
jgi:hypothetical protein